MLTEVGRYFVAGVGSSICPENVLASASKCFPSHFSNGLISNLSAVQQHCQSVDHRHYYCTLEINQPTDSLCLSVSVCLSVCLSQSVSQSERVTERERERRQRQRDRDRETERQRDRERQRQRNRDRETDRQRDRDREGETERTRNRKNYFTRIVV